MRENNKMQDFEYFPKSYDEARANFRRLADKAISDRVQSGMSSSLAGETFSYNVPSKIDSNLFVDYLSLPATEKKQTLLVVVSGVHGPEAFAGHAAQAMFLTELLPKVPVKNVGLLFVHALNPFGFKYTRRSTENNVNLNRNYGVNDKSFEHDNKGYKRVADLVEGNGSTGSTTLALFECAYLLGLSLFKRGFNASELNQTLCEGQYTHPKGLEFGGRTWEPQTAHFLATLKNAMVGYQDILVFDMHTGLGEKFELHVMPPDEKELRHPEMMKRFFGEIETNKNVHYTTADVQGFYRTMGDLNTVIPTLAPKGSRALGLTFEFGTIGNSWLAKLKLFSRVLAENRAFHNGYKSKAAEDINRDLYLETFAPTEKAWRSHVVSTTRTIWQDVFKRIA